MPLNLSTNEIFIELGLVKVRDLISLNQLKIVFDFTQNSLPYDLMNLLSYSSDVHSVSRELNSTVNKLIYISKVKTTPYGLESIRYNVLPCGTNFSKMGKSKLMTIKRIIKNCLK